jgi:membrane-bound lytic murein transglycosylase D
VSTPRQTLAALAPAAAASLLLGCAAHDPAADTTLTARAAAEAATPTELDRLRRAERFEIGASDERQAYELRNRLDGAWEEGQALWLAGELDGAFDTFDAGLEAVVASGIELESHPSLRRRVEDILEGVHALAVEEALRDATAVSEAPELPELDEPGDGSTPRAVAAHAPARAGTPSWLASATGDYTLPMRDHPSVDAMVRFYTERRQEHLERGLSRAGLYGPTVARIFQEEGVPADLMWLALVESNFNAQAYSRARAKGLWQFIPGTGRRYGLKLDFWVDERADFEKATRSSARYLKDLHGMFGDWHLALAAYNAGEGKVGRGIRRTGRSDYWHLRRTRYLRPETKSYVPALLAVMRIVRDPQAHGIRFEPAEALDWEVATVTACADLSVLADCAGTTTEALQQLNPELRRGCTPGDAKAYPLRVPSGAARSFEARFAQLPPEKRLNWARHHVRSGDTLTEIAHRYGSSVAGIMASNGLSSPHRIGVGWTLLVPRGDSAGALAPAAAAASASRSTSATRTYRVRSGDTLAAIARHHGTSIDEVVRLNGIKNANRIRPGQRLLIEGRAPARASASGRYTVRSGDTLSAIAKKHGVSVGELREWNGLPARGYIHPGQELRIHAGSARTTYAVRSGDTLTAIARRFRTTVAALREWNDLSRSGLIHPGDRLTILSN